MGQGDFKTDREDVTYIRCNSEKEIIKEFMTFWMKNYPDIITVGIVSSLIYLI